MALVQNTCCCGSRIITNKQKDKRAKVVVEVRGFWHLPLLILKQDNWKIVQSKFPAKQNECMTISVFLLEPGLFPFQFGSQKTPTIDHRYFCDCSWNFIKFKNSFFPTPLLQLPSSCVCNAGVSDPFLQTQTFGPSQLLLFITWPSDCDALGLLNSQLTTLLNDVE